MSQFYIAHPLLICVVAQMSDKYEAAVIEGPVTTAIIDSEKGSDEAVETKTSPNEPADVPDGGLWAWMAVLGG